MRRFQVIKSELDEKQNVLRSMSQEKDALERQLQDLAVFII